MVIACLTEGFWHRVCAALEMPDAKVDPRFASLELRRDNRPALTNRMSECTRLFTLAELEARLIAHQVPHAAVLGVQAALEQPQAKAREMVVEVEHAELGTIPLVGRSVKFPGAPQAPITAPPTLGQHTDQILSETLGKTVDEISALRVRGVVQ